MAMAMAVVAAAQQFQCFFFFSEPNSIIRTTTRPCSPLLIPPSRRKIEFSLISRASSQTPEAAQTQTAESCVNLGLDLFSKGRVGSIVFFNFSHFLLHFPNGSFKVRFFFWIRQVKDALTQFETALSLNPNPVEAQAAFYNKACCHAYRYNILIQ